MGFFRTHWALLATAPDEMARSAPLPEGEGGAQAPAWEGEGLGTEDGAPEHRPAA
jgi:hypothetical protein